MTKDGLFAHLYNDHKKSDMIALLFTYMWKHGWFRDMHKGAMPDRTLVIKMKGKLKEINAYCAEVGEVSNKYDIDVEFE